MLYRTRATLEQQKQTILANFKWTKKTRYQMHINKASRNLFFQGLSLILTTLPNEIVNILHDYKLYKIPSEIVRALYLSTMCFYLLTPVVHLYLNTSSRRFRKQLYLLSLRIPFVRSIAQKLRKQQKAEEQEMMIQTPRNPNTPTVPVPSRFTVQAEIETTL
ncbi:hypothetical protein M3Y95_01030700 [Aphelenchoides besseyi]|nr:hypothetical protein M3Y95_01030700 [Aphelenchoides besseyi]